MICQLFRFDVPVVKFSLTIRLKHVSEFSGNVSVVHGVKQRANCPVHCPAKHCKTHRKGNSGDTKGHSHSQTTACVRTHPRARNASYRDVVVSVGHDVRCGTDHGAPVVVTIIRATVATQTRASQGANHRAVICKGAHILAANATASATIHVQ